MSGKEAVVPAVETEQETQEVEQQATESVTAESEQAAQEGESATPSGDDATAKLKKSGIQERINELTRQRYDKERALEAARQEAEYWKAQAIQKPEQEAPKPQQSGRPVSENFDSYEEYLEALSDYKVNERLAAAQQEQTQAQKQAELAKQQQKFHARAETLGFDDFVEVVYNPDLQVSQDMIEIAFDSDKGPELLYFLGKNPAEAARIASMSAAQAARELGRLEASLDMPPAKNVSSAPPPIKPISGGGEPPQMDQEKMTPEQWREWRNEQLRAKSA